jgi:hypothetical protein
MSEVGVEVCEVESEKEAIESIKRKQQFIDVLENQFVNSEVEHAGISAFALFKKAKMEKLRKLILANRFLEGLANETTKKSDAKVVVVLLGTATVGSEWQSTL